MMEITITKTDFERALPVGTVAHDEIFNSLLPSIEEKQEIIMKTIVGQEGETILASSESLKKAFIKTVCISAFLADFRQLDLVLTPTGFGIVSNENVSPASKQRVDALESSLYTSLMRSRALLIEGLRSESWGGTEQAVNNISYIYDDNHFLFVKSTYAINHTDRNNIQMGLEQSDDYLREKISDEQMDYILDIYRRNDKDVLASISDLLIAIRRFVDKWIFASESVAKERPLRQLMAILESNPEKYSLYMQSNSYQANHHENFQNTQESSAFIFNG